MCSRSYTTYAENDHTQIIANKLLYQIVTLITTHHSFNIYTHERIRHKFTLIAYVCKKVLTGEEKNLNYLCWLLLERLRLFPYLELNINVLLVEMGAALAQRGVKPV